MFPSTSSQEHQDSRENTLTISRGASYEVFCYKATEKEALKNK